MMYVYIIIVLLLSSKRVLIVSEADLGSIGIIGIKIFVFLVEARVLHVTMNINYFFII